MGLHTRTREPSRKPDLAFPFAERRYMRTANYMEFLQANVCIDCIQEASDVGKDTT